jgi:hypothetical protein
VFHNAWASNRPAGRVGRDDPRLRHAGRPQGLGGALARSGRTAGIGGPADAGTVDVEEATHRRGADEDDPVAIGERRTRPDDGGCVRRLGDGEQRQGDGVDARRAETRRPLARLRLGSGDDDAHAPGRSGAAGSDVQCAATPAARR